jgi:hypothetical protein
MGIIMKRTLILAFLIFASPVTNIAASVESMYKDLTECIILSNDTTCDKLYSLAKVHDQLNRTKLALQEKLLTQHSTQYAFRSYPYSRSFELALGYLSGLTGTALIIATKIGHIREFVSPVQTYLVSTILLSTTAFFICNTYLNAKLCTKKIKEIDAVLAKLDTLQTQLRTELMYGTK